MTNELKNVPELRFSNFCDEWVNYKLGEIVDIRGRIGFRGYTKSDIINKEDGGVLTFSPTNIIYNKLKNTVHDTYITKEKYEESPEIMVKTGDILFVKTGSTLGKSTLVANLNEEATVNPQIAVMRVKVFFHQKFTSTYLTLNKILRQVAQTRIGGAIPTLTESEIKKFQVSFPVYEEQQKIGNFFSKLDRQIELEEEKLELLEQQKKGYMQKIFSQEIRFKDENGNDYPDWKEQKLEELGRFNSGVGFPEKYQGGNLGTPFFKVSDMNLPANKTLMNMANNYVTDQQINEKKWKVINDVPAVIFAKVGAAIMLNRKRIVIEPFLMDNNTMSYSFSTHWDTNFGNIFFQTLNLPKYAQVGALPSYNSKDIGTISVNLPSLSEQQKIGDFFSKLDIFIEKQSDKIELLKERKKGFLQKMFI